jgi:hypothetical protein
VPRAQRHERHAGHHQRLDGGKLVTAACLPMLGGGGELGERGL